MNQGKIGIILCQVGTPSAPTTEALRPYLKQFLSDRRVIDYNPLLWQPILQGIILNTRPQKSAKLYKEIWTKQGSPLMVHSLEQVAGVQKRLGTKFKVVLGLAYAKPSISEAVSTLEAEGIKRIVVLPLFPQFSTTTTASVYDEITFSTLGRSKDGRTITKKHIPTLRFIEPYFDNLQYIHALQATIKRQLQNLKVQPDKFILSFHGIPKRYVEEGDPYPTHCEKTAKLVAKAMGWEKQQWMLTYQSRFGKEEWLTPYTHEVLPELYKEGVKHPFVIAPGFVTDCLETLHELGIEGKEQYAEGGGNPKNYTLAECLNSNKEWVDCMTNLIKQNALGWT